MARNWDPSTIKSKIIKISTSLVMCSLSSQVFAAGFSLLEQNTTNLGLAYSGTAALAEDATTGYFNPAGLTRIRENQVVVSGSLIQGSFEFTPSLAYPSTGENDSMSPLGKDDPARLAAVPTIAIAKRLNENWVFGFNVNSPFGLVNKYDQNGAARYVATTSALYTLNLGPAIAFKADCWSFGLGVDAMYGNARLDLHTGNGYVGQDGFVRNRADGWAYGWHAGMLWEPSDYTRIGLSYRSKYNLHADGTAEFLTGNFNPAVPNFYFMQKVRSIVVLPEIATFSFYQHLGALSEGLSRFALTFDAAWTNWSRFHTLRFRYDPGFTNQQGNGLDNDEPVNFKDSTRFALGLIYDYCPQWKFNFGLAYDESAVRERDRSVRIPDSNRFWVALGAAYTPNTRWRFDLGYAHLFFDNSEVDKGAPYRAYTHEHTSAARVAGSYKPYANIFGLQVRYDCP